MRPKTKLLGITGGIGSGKSFVCRLLEQRNIPVFYCDDEAKRLIRTDELLKQELTRLVGSDLYAADGTLVKPVLAAFLCRGAESASKVDAVVHPRVREVFKEWAARQIVPVAAMECALLFDAGFDDLVDQTVLVHVSDEIRLQRIIQRDHISEEAARHWMGLQLSEDERLQKSDFVINNDGHQPLEPQIDLLLDV